MTGYNSLLAQFSPHKAVLVFLTDFKLTEKHTNTLLSSASRYSTVVFNIDFDYSKVLELLCCLKKQKKTAVFVCYFLKHASIIKGHSLLETNNNYSFARVELPIIDFSPSLEQIFYIHHVIDRSDYQRQSITAKRLFRYLQESVPYSITIKTTGELTINDRIPLFELYGPLGKGEHRILPGGEVAYTGSSINGTFTINGALLATPLHPRGHDLAQRITTLSKHIPNDPITLMIKNGIIHHWTSVGGLHRQITTILNSRLYYRITEVGFSFNFAVKQFIHNWPASSNEGHPGVHVAIGGDPDPDEKNVHKELIHVDFMSTNTSVKINNNIFS